MTTTHDALAHDTTKRPHECPACLYGIARVEVHQLVRGYEHGIAIIEQAVAAERAVLIQAGDAAIAAAVEAAEEQVKVALQLAAEWERQLREARGLALRFAKDLNAERARGKALAEAAKALIEAAHGLNGSVCSEFCISTDPGHQPGQTCAPKEIAAAEAALAAFEGGAT